MNYRDILDKPSIRYSNVGLETQEKTEPKSQAEERLRKSVKMKTDIGKSGFDEKKHNEMLKMLESMPPETKLRIKTMVEQRRRLNKSDFNKRANVGNSRNERVELQRSNQDFKSRKLAEGEQKLQDEKERIEGVNVQKEHDANVTNMKNRTNRELLDKSNLKYKMDKEAEAKLQAETLRDVKLRNKNLSAQKKEAEKAEKEQKAAQKKEEARVKAANTKEEARVKAFNAAQLTMAKNLDSFSSEENLMSLKVAQAKQTHLANNARIDRTTGEYRREDILAAEQSTQYIMQEYKLRRRAKLRKAFIQSMNDHSGDVDAVMKMFEQYGLDAEIIAMRKPKP